MREDRVVNIRFLFCVFIGLMLGIIANYLFLIKKINLFVLILFIILSVIVCCVCWVYAIKTQNFNKQFKARKNVSFLVKCSGLGFVIAFIVGLIIMINPMQNILGVREYTNEVVVNGVICDYIDNESTYTKFLIKDCSIISDADCIDINDKILVYTSEFANLELGDRVAFSGTLKKFEHDDNMSMLSQGIAYSVYINLTDLVFEDGKMEFKDVIKEKVNQLYSSNLNSDNANICYAIMFGDKHGLSEDISEMFSYAGISHILAVSGLHVGVLVAAIWFCINKLRINKYVKLIVLSIILIFYMYLCSFSPSVCRAGIMAITLAGCKTFQIEYDSLSSLSIAGILILLISPISLFSVSFQLSFLCIFAIISLAPSITKLFRKIKLPEVLASSLAMSISVNIVILPVCMNTFSSVSLLGVFANILVLPIFSVLFILLFLCTILGFLITPLGGILKFAQMFLHILKVVVNYVSLIPFGVMKVFNVSYLLIFVIMLICLTIHFWMSRTWMKAVWVSVLSILMSALFVVYSIPRDYIDGTLIISSQYKSNVLVYIENNEVSLIGSDIDSNTLSFIMKDLKLRKLNKIIAYDIKLNSIDELSYISQEYGVDEILLPAEYNYEQVIDKVDNISTFDNALNSQYMELKVVWFNGDMIGVTVKLRNLDLIIPVRENNKKEREYLINNYAFDNVIVNDTNDWLGLLNESKLINITAIDKIILNG